MQLFCYYSAKICTTYFQLFVVVFVLLFIGLPLRAPYHNSGDRKNIHGIVSAFSRCPPLQETFFGIKLSPTLLYATSISTTNDNITIDTSSSSQKKQQANRLENVMASPKRLLEVFESTNQTVTVANNNNDNSNRNSNNDGSDLIDNDDSTSGTINNITTPTPTVTNIACETKVLPHESPIRRYLRRPVTMLTPSKIQQEQNESKNVVITPKRKGYLSWDDYFIGVAVLSSLRSKDPDHAEGACIADAENRIVCIGYSGFPRGCPDTIFPWNDYNEDNDKIDDTSTSVVETQQQWLHSKRPYVCDAATNAVLNKGNQDLAGCRLYVTKYPTSDCVKVMIQSGIQELVILQEKEEEEENNMIMNMSDDEIRNLMSNATKEEEDELASHFMLSMANIHFRYCRPTTLSITLDFDSAQNENKPTITTKNDVKLRMNGSPLSANSMTVDEQEAARILKEETNYDAFLVHNNGRREDYLSWDDYFMSVALLTAQRSKDPNTQVGACIVDGDRRIVGLGYNGMPRGLSDDEMPWAKRNSNPLYNKYKYVTHAEVNAILNSKGSYSSHVNGGTIYVALFPCENCAKMIIQSGIKKVVYLNDIYHDTDGCRASRVMLRCAKVSLQQYSPTMPKMTIRYYDQENQNDRWKRAIIKHLK